MLEAIANRRSIRVYRDDAISKELVRSVLEAGFCAPSAHGKRPWHAVVVRDPAVKDALAAIHDYSGFVSAAPVVIVVCVDSSEGPERFWIEDASAFMENMLIQATGLGLGTCWIGIKGALRNDGRDVEQIVRETLKLPATLRVLGMTPLGVTGRQPGQRKAIDMDSRVHYDRFDMSQSTSS